VKVPLSSGDTITLLTDGVLGKKDPDEVLDRIRSGLEGSPAHPEEVCDRVLAIMEQSSHDDVTLLAARLA
jgi:serine/threonine protein phosphatase PrpC